MTETGCEDPRSTRGAAHHTPGVGEGRGRCGDSPATLGFFFRGRCGLDRQIFSAGPPTTTIKG